MDSDKKITIKAILAQVPGLPVADGKKWQEQIPAKIVGARNTRAEELRRALLCRWLEGDDQAPRSTFPIPAPTEQPAASPLAREPGGSFNLAGFAEAVLEAARSCTTGRFGDHKVFISHVWRQFQACNDFPGMDEPSFKERLAEANQAGLLALSRADLVEIMNPQDVQDSETRYLHATFHFVKI
ncbi:MAG: hypothetical protein JO112_09015 [Planctomycetes bacterium]|nr:hypothetical protein [Planctomycetota bacterium]